MLTIVSEVWWIFRHQFSKIFYKNGGEEGVAGGGGFAEPTDNKEAEAVDMNGRFQMQGGKNWILPKKVNANRFFWDSHWLEIWSNHFCPSMGLNGGSVATDGFFNYF
jgi:hypothetical protein